MTMHIVDTTREAPVTELMVRVDNKYGKFERNALAMPMSTILAYLNAGAAHVHGNVVASAVVSKIRSAIAGENGKASEVTTEQVKAFRKANEASVAASEKTLFNKSIADADEGELGVRRVRESGPRLDPVEREYRDLVLRRAIVICEGARLKLPGVAKDGEAAPSIRFADGSVVTREQLFTRIRESKKPGNGADLLKQAQEIVAARARVAARGTKAGEAVSLESLF